MDYDKINAESTLSKGILMKDKMAGESVGERPEFVGNSRVVISHQPCVVPLHR